MEIKYTPARVVWLLEIDLVEESKAWLGGTKAYGLGRSWS